MKKIALLLFMGFHCGLLMSQENQSIQIQAEIVLPISGGFIVGKKVDGYGEENVFYDTATVNSGFISDL